jgi:hypothetical protein
MIDPLTETSTVDDTTPHNHQHHPHDHPHSHNTSILTSPNPDLFTLQTRQFYNIPPSMDEQEASYLLRTILSFKHYSRHTFQQNHKRMQNFYTLSETHRHLLQPAFTQKLERIDVAIERNSVIAKRIARLGEEMYLGGMECPINGPIIPRQKYRP